MRWKAWSFPEGGEARGYSILRASRKEPGQPWTKIMGMTLGLEER